MPTRINIKALKNKGTYMNKKIFALALICMMLFAMGCNSATDGQQEGSDIGGNTDSNNNQNNADNSRGVEERNADGEFFYRGVVTSTDNASYIVMEIIDSQVAFGIYHVLVDTGTVYVDEDGNAISRDSIKVGDTIEVVFSGQVMLSLPPQIYAQRVILR